MSIFRVNKNNNYTVMSNNHFKEKYMSLKAKGLLSLMLSLPDNWDYSIEGLTKLSKDGDTSVRNALKELEEFGYLCRKRIYENGKIIDWEYNIFEYPQQQENLVVDNQHVDNQVVENNDNKYTNKSNTKELNKSIIINNNTTNFLGSMKKPKKESLYSKTIALINDYTTDNSLRNALKDFLDLQLDIYKENNKTLYINIFKSKLNTLKQFNQAEQLEVVRYATNKGWQNFYPIPKYDNAKSNAVSNDYTEEELNELENINKQREKQGLRVKF